MLDLTRRIRGDGQQTGFDIGAFQTTTSAAADGDAQTWIADTTASWNVSDAAVLVADVRWIDHEEELDLDQSDVTIFPTLATTTTVQTVRNQRTSQRTFEGSIALDLAPTPWLSLSLGYGWSREYLTVPDLESGDGDFRSGLIQNDGLLVGASWRPDAAWTVEASHREFGQNGIQLHDIVEDRARRTEGRIRYRVEGLSAEVFFNHRDRQNDISQTRADDTSVGIRAAAQRGDDLDFRGSYSFRDLEARTLTNFYFDPDPTPVPTIVGFDGQTHTLSGGLGVRPSAGIEWRFDVLFTETTGSFDVRVFDWQSDLAVEVAPGGEAGVRVRYVDYAELGGSDNYDAALTMIYWRQRL